MTPLLKSTFRKYFEEVQAIFSSRIHTELSVRTPFENFIKSLNEDFGLLHEQKRETGVGAPDFMAYRKSVKVGYIEAKHLGRSIDQELKSEQVIRYLASINNILLTNYGRFILVRNGKQLFDVELFNINDLQNPKHIISDSRIVMFKEMIDIFFSYNLSRIESANELARELAKKAKLLRYYSREQLLEDQRGNKVSSVTSFHMSLKMLLEEIDIDECADAYAQTITYSLFLAKYNCQDKELERKTATSCIPRQIGVIKRLFLNISGDSLPRHFSWIVDGIVEILNASNMKKIELVIDSRGRMDRDPFSFFYEDFLSIYDPKKKRGLGVYYTPRPVVNFIVNSVNHILKDYFDKQYGFADDEVTVLDPAVGTGTFLWLVFRRVLRDLENQGVAGMIPSKIREHLLKDFYGFELLITPYVIAHLKLTAVLRRNYIFQQNDRVQVYLTNTLEPTEVHGLMPFLTEITDESRIANTIKGPGKKILAVIGNPPYSGTSANKGEWIQDLLKEGYKRSDDSRDYGYYKVDGKPLDERNPKWLQDDYVKFIRYAQWKIDMAGEGVVGYITNHSYLDNPTFRGMRQSLLNSFNRIYILNLHGSALRREKAIDGTVDENVFDIRPGVAIAVFIKSNSIVGKKVFYADLHGTREHKFKWLDTRTYRWVGERIVDRNPLEAVEWQEFDPQSPYYLFIPVDRTLMQEYNSFPRLDEIFLTYSLSIQTHRDGFAIGLQKEVMEQRIALLRDMHQSDENIRNLFTLKDTSSWRLAQARKTVIGIQDWQSQIKEILYRPFDVRWTFYHNSIIDRTRQDVMKHMVRNNIALLVSRQQAIPGFQHVLVSDIITESCVVSNKTKEGNYHFPLYLHDGPVKHNIQPEFVKAQSKAYGNNVSSEEVFQYIYGILHSRPYRGRYAKFLRLGFPRIPFTEDYDVFKKVSEIGRKLVGLHLMRTRLRTSVRYETPGSDIVEYHKFKGGKVHINDEQAFDEVEKRIWDFNIGCYQVLKKWLKDRKGRKLNSHEIEHFMQIAEVVGMTLDYMDELEEIRVL